MAEGFTTAASGLDFLAQQHVQTPRGDYVHAEYIARAHRGADLDALVTQGGSPIVEGGVALKVGMVPPERRYAVGVVKDGRAEVLAQNDFEAAHAQHYVDAYTQKNAKLDDPTRRHIPTVRAFVATTIDPQNPKRLLPLGMPVEGGAPPPPPDTFWSNTLGREVTAAEAAKLGSGPDPRDAEIKALNAKLDAFSAQMAALAAAQAAPAPAEAKPKPARPMKVAPCGKQMVTGLPWHVKSCKQPECVAAREAKA